ncbi:aldehyde dehydrogenase domain-containing protein [Cyathus striatus]|nr:aldehyde dehydrogenase domain-containing protein [Cyathus striatus]
MSPFTTLVINGHHVPSSDGATFEVHSPYSGNLVGTCASATKQDCEAAISAASNAFKSWEFTDLEAKRNIFLKAAQLLQTDKYRNRIADTASEETSAVKTFSNALLGPAVGMLQSAAKAIDELNDRKFPSGSVKGAEVLVQKRAFGVILAIAPWNAPFALAIRSVAHPMVCGNTVVFKSSEYSPRTQSIMLDLFEEAGLPNGVLNFISTSKEDAPPRTAEMIAHPAVRHLNFTGSDRVGKILAGQAAQHLKPCVLELGGKCPVVVLKDANIAEAAKTIAHFSTANSGQICVSTERAIVHQDVAEEFVAAVKSAYQALKVGDPVTDSSADLSALFTEVSAANIIDMIKEAKEAGAEVVTGDLQRKGNIMQPHLVRNVKRGMRLWERETFGPVLVVATYTTVDEAIELANSTEYSLAAAVWSSDLDEGQKVASRIRAGTTTVNGSTLHAEPSIGFAGLGGASGYGRFDVANFTQERVVAIYH